MHVLSWMVLGLSGCPIAQELTSALDQSPTISLDSGASGTRSQTIQVAISNSSATQMCITDGNSCTKYKSSASSSFKFTKPQEGIKTVRVYLKTGNVVASPISANILFDKTGPKMGAVTASRPESLGISLTWPEAVDNFTAVPSYVVQGDVVPIKDCHSGTALYSGDSLEAVVHNNHASFSITEGFKLYYAVCAVDDVGNVGKPVVGSVDFHDDYLPPEGTFSVASDAEVFKYPKAIPWTLSDITDDVAATHYCILGTGTLCVQKVLSDTEISGILNLGLASGSQTIRARIFDDAGNFVELNKTLVLDTKAPSQVSVTLSDGLISWTAATDAGSGLDHYLLALDRKTPICAQGEVVAGTTFDTSELAGNYYGRICAVDKAGNASKGTTFLMYATPAAAVACEDDEIREDGICTPYVADEPEVSDAWQPAPGTSWQIQFSGTLNTSLDVEMYDVDLFDTTAANWTKLNGKIRICYFSAGSYEDWREDAGDFPVEALGEPMEGWPGEWWLDITHPQVREIMKARLDAAVARGCDGVDPDNVNGYDNPTGLNLSPAMQLDYNRFLADEAHLRGLSIGLKNDVEQLSDLEPWYDWALNEQCNAYGECDGYTVFTEDNDKAVFNIEYVEQWKAASAKAELVCDQGPQLDTLIKTQSLGQQRLDCGS